MMHEREKSDPAVVAVKPVNNARSDPPRRRWSQGQGPRVSIRSKATCAAPLCEVLSPCRGLGHITCKGIASEAGRSRV